MNNPLYFFISNFNGLIYLQIFICVCSLILYIFLIDFYLSNLGKIEEKAADCNGCVISQSINGKKIEPGAGVKKGSVVSLVVGRKDAFYDATSSDTLNKKENLEFDN